MRWRWLRVGWGLAVVWDEEEEKEEKEGEVEPRFAPVLSLQPSLKKLQGWGCSMGYPPRRGGSRLSLHTFTSPFSQPQPLAQPSGTAKHRDGLPQPAANPGVSRWHPLT